MQNKKISSFFNRVSVVATLLVPIVALLGFAPVAPLGIDGTKVIASGALVLVALFSYIVASCVNKKFVLPHHFLFVGTSVAAGTLLVSTFFSATPMQSFFGLGVETWTYANIFYVLVYTLLVSVHARTGSVRHMFTVTLLASAIIAVVFYVLRLTSGGIIGFSIFSQDIVLNSVGRWFDFGFVAVLLVLAMLAYVVSASATALKRTFAWFVAICALCVFLVTASLTNAFLLSIGSIVILVFVRKNTDNTMHDRVSRVILVCLATLSGLFFAFQTITAQSPLFFQGSQIPNLANSKYQIVYRDYPMTFATDTYAVVVRSLKENPVFGVGLTRFDQVWSAYKPVEINNSPFWAVDFSYGFGLPLTILAMSGILGFLGLLAFLLSIVYTLYVLRGKIQSLRYSVLTSFSVLGIIYVFVHTPSAGLLLFLCTIWGITMSYAPQSEWDWTVSNIRKISILIVCVIFLALAYGTGSRILSLGEGMYVLRSVDTLENINKAITKIEPIAARNIHPAYYQTLATLQQLRASAIANKIQTEEKTLSKVDLDILSGEINKAGVNTIAALEGAIKNNPNNYNVYIQKAQFLGSQLGANAITDTDKAVLAQTYSFAIDALKKARALAPQNPNIDLLEAQIEIQQKKYESAQNLLLQAIQKRPAYTDPVSLLAQLQIAQGNIQQARNVAQAGLRSDASNPQQALFIYGQIEREAKNYAVAAQAFEQLVRIQGNNVSPDIARLLADTYVAAGAIAQAKPIYEQLLKINPKDEQLQQIIQQLQTPVEIPPIPAPKRR